MNNTERTSGCLGMLLIGIAVAGTIAILSNILSFINIPSFLCVFPPTIAGVMIAFGYSRPYQTIFDLLRFCDEGSEKRAEVNIATCNAATIFYILSGFIGVMIGITIAVETDDPFTKRCGYVNASLSILYALLFSLFILQPAKYLFIYRKTSDNFSREGIGRVNHLFYAIAITLLILASLISLIFTGVIFARM